MPKKLEKHYDIPLSSNEFKLEKFYNTLKDVQAKYFFNDITQVQKFEQALANTLNTKKEIVCLSSGTSAIHLALILAGVQKGDYVLCQSFTYIATVNPILYLEAKPIFIDSEKDTWNMDLDLLEEALDDLQQQGIYPKAVIAVNVYGVPTDLDRLNIIAQKYRVKIIEDAAESLGATFKGKKSGTQGDYGILSFNNNKILSTGGGGALICDSEEKRKALFYANQSREKNVAYIHKKKGYNYRLSNIQAILGMIQLPDLENNILMRKKINRFYKEILKDYDDIHVFDAGSEAYESNYWLSCVLIKESAKFYNRDLLKVFSDHNIEARLPWNPMHRQPLLEKYRFYGNNVSYDIHQKGLCLPSGSDLSKEDRGKITEVFRTFLE